MSGEGQNQVDGFVFEGRRSSVESEGVVEGGSGENDGVPGAATP